MASLETGDMVASRDRALYPEKGSMAGALVWHPICLGHLGGASAISEISVDASICSFT